MPQPAKPVGRLSLHLSHHGTLGQGVDIALARNLSVLDTSGPCLWTASDETCQIERLRLDAAGAGKGGGAGDHTVFPLTDFFELPAGPEGEADIEGISYAAPWLWVTGSMSLARKKPKVGEKDAEAALERLTEVKTDPNRWLLGRIPCLPAADGGFELRREVVLADGTHLAAGCLKMTDHGGNPLTKALKGDEHLARFLEIPAKENGFDVEGIAAATGSGGERVFLGLRGPVLRGWAVVLELRLVPGKAGRLKLAPIGELEGDEEAPDADDLYRKHFLDLDGLGIRDMKVDGDDLLLLAGPTMDLDGPVDLWRWPGALRARQADVIPRRELVHVLRLPNGQGFDHAEGVALLPGPGGGRRLLVAYDNPGRDRMHPDEASVDLDLFDLP
ncbi:DUF3616 domain-containing protein [Rhodocista pekingensis]|uniref:DUF3616 domain-containing protein n=1 Tax=Rhodocista pekingensis TaxID=201185 RepID=A0ABW2L1I1_9PROT